MESSRIFVRGLPPTLNEDAFRSHFQLKDGQITDVRLIAPRRIGYVGYRNHEEAKKAVKHFNRSFIRMSKVSVELAKPIADPSLVKPKPSRTEVSSAKSPTKAPVPTDVNAESSKKRKRDNAEESDPKLNEYLGVMQASKNSANKIHGNELEVAEEPLAPVDSIMADAGASDDEYEAIPARKAEKREREPKRAKSVPDHPLVSNTNGADTASIQAGQDQEKSNAKDSTSVSAPEHQIPENKAADDDDWLRSRTNRLLDLVDDPDELAPANGTVESTSVPPPKSPSLDGSEDAEDEGGQLEDAEEDKTASNGQLDSDSKPDDIECVRRTRRLFLRNLAYSATEDDLREYFEKFGPIEEVHMPTDKSGKKTGFAYVLFTDSDPAVEAFQNSGAFFQGRLLHILPAAAKRDHNLDEYELSKLPLKQQALLRKRAKAATDKFNWNSLFMSQDAVVSSVSDRLGVSKSDLLDPHSSDAAVKQAIAETSTIQDSKSYFAANGVDLNAFKSSARGDTAILVKNFSYGTSIEELRTLFEEHGHVLRVLMPPAGTIAIVQFAQAPQAKSAFSKLAYRRFKNSMLYLEKAPKNLFVDGEQPIQEPPTASTMTGGVQKLSVSDLLDQDSNQNAAETGSLYVRNLSFNTTTETLSKSFEHLEGYRSAQVKMKKDPKRGMLSMGYGFVHFSDKKCAEAAAQVMDGFALQGHKIQVKQSHRGLDAAEERKRDDQAKKAVGTKIIVKNLAWEASKKDIRTLFGHYGQLRSVRVPKKFNKGSRGFAFCEFASPRDAESAMNALKDTHLLGRKLVLDFAEADTVDAEEEIEKMQQKVGRQANSVALQQLTGGGRKRVRLGGDGDEDDVEGGA